MRIARRVALACGLAACRSAGPPPEPPAHPLVVATPNARSDGSDATGSPTVVGGANETWPSARPDAPPSSGAGPAFERAYGDAARIDLPDHEIHVSITLGGDGEAALAVTLGLTAKGAGTASAEMSDQIAIVDADGTTHVAELTSVEESPHNGGGPVVPSGGRYVFTAMRPSVIDDVVLTFAHPVGPPARALRVTIDGQEVDVPLRFGPPTKEEVPDVDPDVVQACGQLERCCEARQGASRKACLEIANSARQSDEADWCRSAMPGYCR
jgi:hypothetical protein